MSAPYPTSPATPRPAEPPARTGLTALAGALWVLVGAGFGLGISVLGIIAVPLSLVGCALLLTLGRRWASSTAVLVLSGLGSVPLYVAWLNRSGPGDVCYTTPEGGGGCTQEWSPWPWLGVGLVLVVLGITLLVRRRRRTVS